MKRLFALACRFGFHDWMPVTNPTSCVALFCQRCGTVAVWGRHVRIIVDTPAFTPPPSGREIDATAQPLPLR